MQLPNSPYQKSVAVTPSDVADTFNKHRGLYIGAGGDVKVTTKGGDVVTFIGVAGGSFMPVAVTKVWATGTNATNIMGMN